jgi:hypothetical protein
MIRALAHAVRDTARDFYTIPLYVVVHWYFGAATAFVAGIFFFIGGFEGRAHALKQMAKPEGDFL